MNRIKVRGDMIIWLVVILLAALSLMGVYSASSSLVWKQRSGFTEYYLIRRAIILLIGFTVMYGVHLIPYRYFSRIFLILLYLSVPLLIATLLYGKDLNHARRVLPLPFGLSFQTSDFAKLALIVYLARELTIKQVNIKSFKEAFVPLILPVIVVTALIFPANLSTAALLFATSLVLMFIGRVNMKYILSTVAIGILGVLLLVGIAKTFPDLLPRKATWEKRIDSFLNDKGEENFQVTQSKIAIASGGITGKGPGNSEQRNVLPHPYSDFIYAFLIEEYGIFMGAFVLLLYFILFFRALTLIRRTNGDFGAFLAIGIVFSLVFQALVNMAVAVNLFPVTGQPLPLVSMGGTSFLFTSLGIGVLLSVSREVYNKQIETT
jgi:cell division protein FtsW